MNISRILAVSFASALIPLAAASCSSLPRGGGGGSGGSGAASGAGGSAETLKWYSTCGDPVCGPGGGGSGLAACTTEKEGDACSTKDVQCDPGTGCNVHLICAASDPELQPGGCPKSRARFKKEISYLPDSDLMGVHDDLMAMRLATWRYTSEPGTAREHLGFIIDDNPALPAVHASGDHVDLYGYTSMAVAAIQVQAKQIEDLKAELKELRDELRTLHKASEEPGERAR